jgi:hypothetical protein
MKYNRNQLLVRRQRIADLKSMYSDSIKIKGYRYHEEKIPNQIVEKVKSDIRNKIRKKRIRSTIFSIMFTLLIIAIVSLFLASHMEF